MSFRTPSTDNREIREMGGKLHPDLFSRKEALRYKKILTECGIPSVVGMKTCTSQIKLQIGEKELYGKDQVFYFVLLNYPKMYGKFRSLYFANLGK